MSLSCFPILVLILCAAALPAAIFEVDQLRGNDGNPGSSAQPLATIAAAQAKLANPGDVVLIHAGRYFVHAWKANVSGAAGNPITYRAAPGETVIIDFGLQVSGAWRADGGGLWSAPFSGDSGRVVIDGRALVLAAAGTTPSAGSFQVANGRLALFPPAGVRAPDSAEVVILNPTYPASSADCSLHVTANHIALERLILQGGSWGIYGGDWGAAKNQYRDLTIADCEIRFMTTYALCLWGWENCTMSRCSVHGVNQLNWPRGSSSTWGHAIIGWNSSNVTVEDCQVFANHGEGIGPFLGCRDWRIRRNTVYDNYSVNIYIDTDEDDAAMVVDRNLVYVTGTIGSPADFRNFPDGIRVTNEGACDWYLPYQDQTPVVSNVTITNNLVIDCGSNGGITSFQYQDIGYVLDRSLIAGNTVVRSRGNTAGISIQAATNTTLANNLVYPALTYLPGSGLASSGNLFTDSAPFTVGTGIDPANYRPAAGSPAVSGGTTLAALSTDFFGAARSSPPDVGACQHLALNAAPSVSAGPDRSITLPATASLDGTVTNDGLPSGAAVTSTWSKVSGPGTVTFGSTAAVDTTAVFSVAGTYVLRLTASDSLLSVSDEVQVVVNAAPAIPAGWNSQDFGTTTPAGSALGDGADWTIRGGGPDIWNQADGARFAWQSLTGDCDLVVRVVSQTNTNAWAKAGLMIRESSAAGSRHISLFVTPGNGVSLQHRANTNGSSSSLAGPKRVAAPTWLKLIRRGSVFTGWQSANGTTWTLVGSRTVAIPASALVGLAVSSRTTTTLSTAVFAGFSSLPMANN